MTYFETPLGRMMLGDSLDLTQSLDAGSVDLIMTSPPFALLTKKAFDNADAADYLDWFRPFAEAFRRVLSDTGSLVIDIGGTWQKSTPTRSLYHFKLLIMLVEEYGFHLAQEFYWWNPNRLPTPAEWVTIRRIRVKDAINAVWWLSPTPWPRASNRRVLQPYSSRMQRVFDGTIREHKNKSPSGHDKQESEAWVDNSGAIPPNLITIANTESNSSYFRYCKEHGIKPHSARFPADLPEYFIRMLTDEGHLVFDPFAGSCVTGEVAERLNRKWICAELDEQYLRGALGRFQDKPKPRKVHNTYYQVPRPGILWNNSDIHDPLPDDGGREHRQNPKKREPASQNRKPGHQPPLWNTDA